MAPNWASSHLMASFHFFSVTPRCRFTRNKIQFMSFIISPTSTTKPNRSSTTIIPNDREIRLTNNALWVFVEKWKRITLGTHLNVLVGENGGYLEPSGLIDSLVYFGLICLFCVSSCLFRISRVWNCNSHLLGSIPLLSSIFLFAHFQSST